jgi:hypothetical protein
MKTKLIISCVMDSGDNILDKAAIIIHPWISL